MLPLFDAGLCFSGAPGCSERWRRLSGGGPSEDPDVPPPALSPSLPFLAWQPSGSSLLGSASLPTSTNGFDFLFPAMCGCLSSRTFESCFQALVKTKISSLLASRVRRWVQSLSTISLVSFEGSNILKPSGTVSTSRKSAPSLLSSSQGTRALRFSVIFTDVDQNIILDKKIWTYCTLWWKSHLQHLAVTLGLEHCFSEVLDAPRHPLWPLHSPLPPPHPMDSPAPQDHRL